MDVTDATFQQMVIDRSHEVTVVVDFWASWCAPCRQLAPLLDAGVARHGGEVELAKVDIDANPALTRTYGVQSVPTVIAFHKGEAVNQFVGLLPPEALASFLAKLVPSDADRLVAEGGETALRAAIEADPGHTQARLDLGRLLIDDGDLAAATEVLTPAVHDLRVAGILARLSLSDADSPDIAAGLAALDRGDIDAALTSLLDAIVVAGGELRERVRKVIVGVFATLGEQHPTTVRFRKRLSRALY